MFEGAALPSPKRLRAGRCKGIPAHPTAIQNVFDVTDELIERNGGRE